MLPHLSLTHTHAPLTQIPLYPSTDTLLRKSTPSISTSRTITKEKVRVSKYGSLHETAFLHGDLDEQIYMQQPEGFKEPNKEEYVCLLQKSLYGLK